MQHSLTMTGQMARNAAHSHRLPPEFQLNIQPEVVGAASAADNAWGFS
jgi:hypothetical protein